MEVKRLATIQRSMMKKWVSLYDLCPVEPGTRNDGTVRITAMAYLKNCPDNAQQMEKQLLRTSEYILLRGKHGGDIVRRVPLGVGERKAVPQIVEDLLVVQRCRQILCVRQTPLSQNIIQIRSAFLQ